MLLNPDRCEVTHVTNKRNTIISTLYTIHDTPLKATDAAKYLGVTIAPDINWKTHINSITKRPTQLCPSYGETSDLAHRTPKQQPTRHTFVSS